jgi:hypothetical protein
VRTPVERHAVSDHTFSGRDVWSNPLEVARQTESAASQETSALSDMPTSSTNGAYTSGSVENKPQKYFVYSGETLNHGFLPHMTGHRRFYKGNQGHAQIRLAARAASHSDPRPAALPSIQWTQKRLQKNESEPSVFDHLPSEDVFYLTRLKNILYFPRNSIAHDFLKAFKEHVLPEFPVIDRYQMNDIYDDFLSGVVKSPMLIHAVFFSSSKFVEEGALQQAGFESRSTASEYFYARATILYSMNCENDQFKIVQTLLFVSPWWADYSEEKGTKYWITCVSNLVLAMGLHKAVPAAARITSQERSLWRRIFWTVFVSDYSRESFASRHEPSTFSAY